MAEKEKEQKTRKEIFHERRKAGKEEGNKPKEE